MKLLHAAVQFEREENATFFFEGILKAVEKREFTLNESLAQEIFGIREKYMVKIYEFENADIEIFIGKKFRCVGLFHIAIGMPFKTREEIIKTARSFGLKVYEKERTGKDKLVFITDPEGNLYELKSTE